MTELWDNSRLSKYSLPTYLMKPLFEPKKRSALEAQYEAQKIAYAPIIFQAVRALRDLGILEQLDKAGKQGISAQSIADNTELSLYGVETLIESGLSCDVVEQNQDGLLLLLRVVGRLPQQQAYPCAQ